MPLYLLDTNVLSRLVRNVDEGITQRVQDNLDLCVLSSVVWYELQFGAARSSDPKKAGARLNLLRTIFPFVRPFGEDDAAEAAIVRAQLETLRPNAQPIGPHDVLIAGQALALGATLVTHNQREFGRVSRLLIEDWQSPL